MPKTPIGIHRIAAIVMAALSLNGCGLFSRAVPEAPAPRLAGGSPPSVPAPDVHAAIPAPEIPPLLAQKAGAAEEAAPDAEELYALTIECSSPDPELCELFEKAARLSVMNREDQGRASRLTLDRRLQASVEQDGLDMLHSLAYYEGQVDGRLEPDGGAGRLRALIAFRPGPRYRIGQTRITLDETPEEAPPSEAQPPPADLTEAGLTPGGEARAEAVLAAVDRVPGLFRNRGYPRARVSSARYFLTPSEKVLEAEVRVRPGPLARMGQISPVGEPVVDAAYLDAQRTWKTGQIWNQDLAEEYLAALRQSGLFQTVEGASGRQKGADGLNPLRLRLTPAPPRSVGGLISYDTDFGPGLTAYWEHRNLSGHGDRLRLDLPLWADLQEFTAAYRYPFFLGPRQDFIARGGLLHQDTEAYELWSAAFAAGIERRLSRRWKVSLMGSAEGGALTDPGEEEEKFLMLGLPLSAAYDDTDSIMDPVKGGRLILQIAPYQGTYKKDFTVIRARLEGQAFIPLFAEKLVLAARAVWGGVLAAESARDLPSALRFYSGGGGSVRGYEYQSIGPRNESREPLGGISQFETNLETRLRLSETLGLAAFLDGGMVCDEAAADVFSDLLWGAGAGLRMYTPIGPVRADLAFPLNRRPGDSAWQAYISIGQSF